MLQSDGAPIDAANEIAKQIDSHATDYSTKNNQALEAFAAAAEAAGATAQIAALERAINLDAGFGAAYLTLADVLARNGQNIQPLLAKARAHESAFTPLDRARFDELDARASHAPLATRASAASKILHLAPNDLDALINLASDRFLQGDAAGAALLQRASEIDPGNASIRLALAKGLLETKQFAQAEKVLAGLDGNPDVLPDLAVCLLLEGDRARADSVFAKYIDRLKQSNEPFAPIADAGWLAISGRMPQAITRLEAAQFAQPDLQSLAWSQIAIWQAAEKDTAGAKESAAQSSKLAKATIARVFAAAAALIASGDLPSGEWSARVDTAPLSSNAKQTVLGYGFFLFGNYADAAQVWQALLKASGNADLRARAMLASSLDRSGKQAQAAKVFVQPFLPNLNGGDPYAAIAFAQMRQILNRKAQR